MSKSERVTALIRNAGLTREQAQQVADGEERADLQRRVAKNDRHRTPRVTLRATPERMAAWRACADAAGVTLTEFAGMALDSFVASMRTATLRVAKHERTAAHAHYRPCDDAQCSLPYGHAGRHDFLRDA